MLTDAERVAALRFIIMDVSFTVYGMPQQRGSKRPLPAGGKVGGRPLMVDDNPKSTNWMQMVTSAAAAAYNGPLLEGPITLTAKFYFPRVKSHFRTTKKTGTVLREDAPTEYAKAPDLSKLLRCLEDGLTGVVWVDDRMVSQYGAGTGKYWADQARTEVTISVKDANHDGQQPATEQPAVAEAAPQPNPGVPDPDAGFGWG